AAPLAVPDPITRVAVRSLTFRYPGRDETALTDLTASFSTGLTGIVGRSGSGKSTLCQLLARLYQLEEGRLLVNEVDVNRLSITALRDRIAYVPQEATLFSDTIEANITMGNPDASPAEIAAVARAVAMDREIEAMADGYHTRIGEKGIKLSGGQRQRLALARALLLHRPILIIDDALAAVDVATEQRIIAAIRPFLAHRICIVVSHRVAVLADADEILVLEQGRLVGRGPHARLIADNDFYATIHRHQTTRPAGEEGE
ncbi:MAG: ABC transporter ATP-binding protein/permease, partial [Desulfobulbaceae bacterium]|nr:ABC transporter ATP-binding protein/permease [Desulfobulbaceae bacterium]